MSFKIELDCLVTCRQNRLRTSRVDAPLVFGVRVGFKHDAVGVRVPHGGDVGVQVHLHAQSSGALVPPALRRRQGGERERGEGGRDGGTEGRRDGGTEGRRDGGAEGRRDEGTQRRVRRTCRMALSRSDGQAGKRNSAFGQSTHAAPPASHWFAVVSTGSGGAKTAAVAFASSRRGHWRRRWAVEGGPISMVPIWLPRKHPTVYGALGVR